MRRSHRKQMLFVQRQLPVRLTLYARTPTLLLFDYKSHYSIVLQEAQGQPFKTSSSKCRFVKDVLQIKEKRKGPVKGRASLKDGWENGCKPVHGRLAEL